MYKKLILIVSLVISGIAIHAQTAQALRTVWTMSHL